MKANKEYKLTIAICVMAIVLSAMMIGMWSVAAVIMFEQGNTVFFVFCALYQLGILIPAILSLKNKRLTGKTPMVMLVIFSTLFYLLGFIGSFLRGNTPHPASIVYIGATVLLRIAMIVMFMELENVRKSEPQPEQFSDGDRQEIEEELMDILDRYTKPPQDSAEAETARPAEPEKTDRRWEYAKNTGMVTCPSCGMPRPANEKHCGRCGAELWD